MTLTEAMSRLEALGNEKMRAMNIKNGAGDNQFGVKMGDIRTIAKEIKVDHDLAMHLWETGNVDARFLALLIIKPKQLTADELEEMVKSNDFAHIADWLSSYVIKAHPEKEALRQRWMQSDHPMLSRAGWSLTTERINKSPEGLDIPGLLDRIDRELSTKPYAEQWAMNFSLIDIGIQFPEHRERAIAIGEKHGYCRDYPTSKGCVSPFAPIAIRELASRQK
ncbi:MAG: DNA alkylation repair protein [Fimbriimonadaceae bacterium]|nr:MAG: DNA alkylation repair protein [Fimbriimonadaceae bacterium]